MPREVSEALVRLGEALNKLGLFVEVPDTRLDLIEHRLDRIEGLLNIPKQGSPLGQIGAVLHTRDDSASF